MSTGWKLVWIIILLLIFSSLGWLAVEAGTNAWQGEIVPEGFHLLSEDIGVKLFRKDYNGGSPDFVQTIDFNQGAAIKLLHGPVTQERPNKGVFGGNDARIQSKSLLNFWKSLVSQTQNAFCITNGQFFYMPESPTRLSLPLKSNNQVITDGFAADEFIGKRLMLELWEDHVDIRELDGKSLYSSSAPEILGGLTVDANRRAKKSVGRTFAGVDDRDGDGVYETVYLFNTRTALQTEAAAVLESFGADKVMMLDGGGSTQLICKGDSIIYSERLIPQAVGVIAGSINHATANLKSSDDQPTSSIENDPAAAEQVVIQDYVGQPVNQEESVNEMVLEKGPLNFGNAAMIPLLMLPGALIVLVFINHVRKTAIT